MANEHLNELPSITKAFYSTKAYTGEALASNTWGGSGSIMDAFEDEVVAERTLGPRTRRSRPMQTILAQVEKNVAAATGRRVVQVFIIDPDENVPLDQCLLYKGDVKLTDLTDQELFFEVDIKRLMDSHNETRKGIVNKKIKERTEYLEPVRIRDLKMTVVDIATF